MLDPRVNKTDYDEDSTMRELEDRQTDKLFQVHHRARPLSAKVVEKRQVGIVRPKNMRPISAKKNTMSPIKRPETYLNSRIRPNVAGLEKERLYDENIALKIQINAFKADLTNTKTRLKQLERENKRQNEEIEEISTYDKTPAHKYIRLTNALRKTVKELKNECRAKDEEISKLKKSVKISKITELEVETQTLKEECKRLKAFIEDGRKKNESPVMILPDNRTKEFTALKKEKLELEAQVRNLTEENKKMIEKKTPVKNKDKGNDKELNKSLKLEVQKLKHLADAAQKENFEKEKNFKAEISELRKKEEEIYERLEKEQKKSAGLINKIENFEKIVKSLQEKIETYEKNKSSEKNLKTDKKTLKPEKNQSENIPKDPEVTPNDISDILKHFYLSMQLHRLDIDRLADVLLSKLNNSESSLKLSELSRMFPSPPFAFTSKTDMTLLYKFLSQSLSSQQSESSKSLKINPLLIIEKLKKHLPSWKVFDTEEESDFDNQLATLIRSRKEDLRRECTSYDSQNTGIIEMRQFKLALKDSKLIIQPRLFEYMTLLFYSHEYEIDKVPYKNFLKAYGESPESEVFIDEEKLQVIKSCLSQIAQSLIRHKWTVREVFKTKGSLVYPEDFVQGLETLAVNNLSRDTIMMVLDQLQYENETESCILLEEFEKIMESLGVTLMQKDKKSFVSLSSRGSSDKSSNFKKVSAAESENYEYSEDSPGRYGISEISPFGSVSNAEFPGKSSPTINDLSKIDLERIKDESSESEDYEKMKKIDFSPDNVKKKENFSPKKQKIKESSFSSPGEGKTLEYSLTVAPQDKSLNNDLPDSKLLRSGTGSRSSSEKSDQVFSQFSDKSKGNLMSAKELEGKEDEDRYSSDYNSSDEEKSFRGTKSQPRHVEIQEVHRKNSSSPVESYGKYADYEQETREKLKKIENNKEWILESSYQEIPASKSRPQENDLKKHQISFKNESFDSVSLASKGKKSSRSSIRSESLADKAQRKYFVEENTGNATFGGKFEKAENSSRPGSGYEKTGIGKTLGNEGNVADFSAPLEMLDKSSSKRSEKSQDSEKSLKGSKRSSNSSVNGQPNPMTARVESSSSSEEKSESSKISKNKESSKKSESLSNSFIQDKEVAVSNQGSLKNPINDQKHSKISSSSSSSSESSKPFNHPSKKQSKESSKSSSNHSKVSKKSEISSKISSKKSKISSKSSKQSKKPSLVQQVPIKLSETDSKNGKDLNSSKSSSEFNESQDSRKFLEAKTKEVQPVKSSESSSSEEINEINANLEDSKANPKENPLAEHENSNEHQFKRGNEESQAEFEGYLMNNFPTLSKEEKNLSSVGSLQSSRSIPQKSEKKTDKSERNPNSSSKSERNPNSSSKSSEDRKNIEKTEDRMQESLKNNENQPIFSRHSFEGIIKQKNLEEQKVESWKASYELHGNSEVELDGNYFSQAVTPSLKSSADFQDKNIPTSKLETPSQKSVSKKSSEKKKSSAFHETVHNKKSSKQIDKSSSSEKSIKSKEKNSSLSKKSSLKSLKSLKKSQKSSVKELSIEGEKSSLKSPKSLLKSDKSSAENKEISIKGGKSSNSEKRSGASEKFLVNSEKSSDQSEKSSNSGKSSDKSEKSSNSGKSSDKSEKSSKSEKPSDQSEKSSDQSEKSSDQSEKSSDQSEKSSDKRQKLSIKSEKSSNKKIFSSKISEKPSMLSHKSSINSLKQSVKSHKSSLKSEKSIEKKDVSFIKLENSIKSDKNSVKSHKSSIKNEKSEKSLKSEKVSKISQKSSIKSEKSFEKLKKDSVKSEESSEKSNNFLNKSKKSEKNSVKSDSSKKFKPLKQKSREFSSDSEKSLKPNEKSFEDFSNKKFQSSEKHSQREKLKNEGEDSDSINEKTLIQETNLGLDQNTSPEKEFTPKPEETFPSISHYQVSETSKIEEHPDEINQIKDFKQSDLEKHEKPYLDNDLISSSSKKSKDDDDSSMKMRKNAPKSPILINVDPPNPVLISVTDKDQLLVPKSEFLEESKELKESEVLKESKDLKEPEVEKKSLKSHFSEDSISSSSSEESSSSLKSSEKQTLEKKEIPEPNPPKIDKDSNSIKNTPKSSKSPSIRVEKSEISSSSSSSDSSKHSKSGSSKEIQKIQENSFKIQAKSPELLSSDHLETPEDRFNSKLKTFSKDSSSSSFSGSSNKVKDLNISPISEKTNEKPEDRPSNPTKPLADAKESIPKQLNHPESHSKPSGRPRSSVSEDSSSSSAELEVFDSRSSDSSSNSESSESFS